MTNNLGHIEIPSWVDGIKFSQKNLSTDSDKMNFVIDMSYKNVVNKTGGPFAAAVFNIKTQELISIGLNVVIKSNASIAHAEIMAITLAQKKLNSFSLSNRENAEYELITSSEPCSMCFGALLWSGIKRCVSGATASDVESIGFDEGEKPINWVDALKQRGIDYIGEVHRESAKCVLNKYYKNGGKIYNG